MEKKIIICFVLLLITGTGFTQTKQILNILNRELQKEVRYQKEDSIGYLNETFDVIQYYKISEEGILSVEVRKKKYYTDTYYNEKQEVSLKDIHSILKDINTLFQTEMDAVKITIKTTEADGSLKVEESYRDLFFLHLSHEQQNEFLANELVKAFKNAKLSLQKNGWYD